MLKYCAVLCAAVSVVSGGAFGVPFDSTTGSAVVATVNPVGGDYASIATASAAFSSTSGINRPWTLEIQTTMTETSDSYFGNTFGAGGSLTIRPKAGIEPLVNFNNFLAPAGNSIAGHLVFGVTNSSVVSATNVRASSSRYILDGCSTPGGTARELTFTTAIGSDSHNRVVRVFGANTGVVIKNMIIRNNDADGNCACISYSSGNVSGVGNIFPDNGMIQNCSLSCLGTGPNGMGVETGNATSAAPPVGQAIQGLAVSGNTMDGRQRGVLLNFCGNATITGNRIGVYGIGTSIVHSAIHHSTSNGAVGWTLTINGNTITMPFLPTVSPPNGGIGINLDTSNIGNYVVSNNILQTISFGGPSFADFLVRGISCGTVNSTYLIEHNSLDLGAAIFATAATTHRVAAIAVPTTFTTGTAMIRNNILKFGNPGGNAALISLASATNVTAVGNNLVPNGTPNFGVIADAGAPLITTLAAWRTAGFDSAASGGQTADPASTTPAWDANLHFASKPVGGMGAVATSTVLADVDGQVRPATSAVPGADEPGGILAGIDDWSRF
ncbi:MAG: hypothetical protein K1X53_16985 [Candidatus Sumerlaeaceae bacterium]|nr:hypothetical protein [Candidatus Sumerlaeaceae bacterium]